MKVSVLIPVLNEEKHLPALFAALKRELKNKEVKIIFIENGSEDQSPALLEKFAAAQAQVQVLREEKRGFAAPLNRGLAEARSAELVLFLDADAVPAPGWIRSMITALSKADIVVGETVSSAGGKSPYARLAAKVFAGHSARAAQAIGHALPWGPTCNLGVRRGWFDKAGLFSEAATGAFDIDWCWRAVLLGAKIHFEKSARVNHVRRSDAKGLWQQFERYGKSEAWLHRTYQFLLDPEEPEADPQEAALAAFTRLLRHSPAAKIKTLRAPLEEVACAFAVGVRLGYEEPYQRCPEVRALPKQSVAWESGKNAVTLFVPGKGIATLAGKQKALWSAVQSGAGVPELAKLVQKQHRIDPIAATIEARQFLEAVQP